MATILNTGLTSSVSKLTKSVQNALSGKTAAVAVPNTVGDDIIVSRSNADDRIRLSAFANQADAVYGTNDKSNIMSILHTTGGMMFPYTPTVSVSQAINWDPISLIQTNFDINSYQRTPSVTISVAGPFTAQTQREGLYCLAVIHFLRTVSKSHFGTQDGSPGLPPPILKFSGYGSFMFSDLKCVLKSYSFTFDDSVDSNLFKGPTGDTFRIPAKFNISIELGIQQTAEAQRDEFNLEDFRTGKLLSSKPGWF